jgi:hypothetical protein
MRERLQMDTVLPDSPQHFEQDKALRASGLLRERCWVAKSRVRCDRMIKARSLIALVDILLSVNAPYIIHYLNSLRNDDLAYKGCPMTLLISSTVLCAERPASGCTS